MQKIYNRILHGVIYEFYNFIKRKKQRNEKTIIYSRNAFPAGCAIL